MSPADALAHATAVARWYEALTPATLGGIRDLYAEDARFKDPFNQVHGRARIQAVMAHMFQQVAEPRFVVDDLAVQGRTAWLGWTLHHRRHGAPGAQRIVGCTRLRLDAQGRVAEHTDFWDPAEALYAQVPVLGTLLGWLRRRLAAPQR